MSITNKSDDAQTYHISPLILGFQGATLSPDLRKTITRLSPAGFILFRRNIESPQQLKKLCDDLKKLSSLSSPLIFIDQEGGRVIRIRWPEVYTAPPARRFGELYEQNPEKGLKAAQWSAYLTARELHHMGITANCMPVADLAVKGAHSVIGDRAYSVDPNAVAALCAAAIKGTMAGGVWPVIKHAPGHGRAQVDSHVALPQVDENAEILQNDLYPFKVNNQCPFVMTAHVTYTAFDDACATMSSTILKKILRQECGMKGIFIADDMFMQALDGSLHERIENATNAGCDLVICGSNTIEGSFSEEMWQQIEQLNTDFSLCREVRQRLQELPTLPSTFDVTLHGARKELAEVMAA